MTPSLDDAQQMSGATVTGADGAKIGKVADVYIDHDTQTPEWALVHTGLFGGRESFVPLAQASMDARTVRVPYSKEQVTDAPNAEPDGELSQEEEARLYAHYGLNYSEATSDSGLPAGGSGPSLRGEQRDDAMTRSEERLRVGVQKRPSQTVRLRKYVVTENVSTTVPLTTERATIHREPITDANRDRATDGAEITEAEHEVILTEERPVVAKETVPIERVRLAKETISEQETVSGEVRKEVIELDEGVDTDVRTDRGSRR